MLRSLQPDTRIAVVEPDRGRLLAAVRALPVRCEIRRFSDVGADMTELLQFRPQVLLFAASPEDEDLAGTVRVARSALGSPPVVLVTDPAHEADTLVLAQRTGARVLVEPEKAGALAAALERTLAGADPNRHAAFLQIARGLADEINNPLMYLSGHLQLLERGLEGDPRLGQVEAAREGADRIRDTVGRLRLLVEAETGLPEPEDLRVLVRDALATTRALRAALAAEVIAACTAGPAIAISAVPALRPALAALFAWLDDLVAGEGECSADIELAGPPRPTLTIRLHGAVVDEWQPARSFSPYSLTRGLGQGAAGPQSGSHGLTMFLVHTAVHSSGAMAVARRRQSGGMEFELRWP